MGQTLNDLILRRELGNVHPRFKSYTSIKELYGHKTWVEDLDIVNELDGHSGCVNALSWSRSGRLLASGSDDQHINIHTYLPEASTSQLQFTTTIATGHQANIFSVKFMPHSNDRTIVSAAGDHEVRIFDIEYASKNSTSSVPSAFRTSSRRNASSTNIFNGVQYLSEGDTNAKVFRSHSDPVKRIVTESSPFFFLTCSEDGEVRQWDIRQPSSAYPSSNEGFARSSISSGNMPPALISYKSYGLDLNTISCSPSQPHYIALGGAHLHCFLHDRRMLGRDMQAERGGSSSQSSKAFNRDEESMNRATRCVKKFAPNGKRTMRQSDRGHITACKISDANPNELLVSWSGDWIYNFDINRTPDASATVEYTSVDTGSGGRVKDSNARKRKRVQASSTVSREATNRAGSRARKEGQAENNMALMVHYENGQHEEIPIQSGPTSDLAETSLLSAAERMSHRISSTLVKIRRNIFTLGDSKPTSSDPFGHSSSFTSVFGFSAAILPDMDDLMGSWRYPVDPPELEIEFQNELRSVRGSARRLVQAAGTLARLLEGSLRMGGASDPMIAKYFTKILPAPNERSISRHEQFGYDFLKAIILWLDSGIGSLIEGFSPSEALSASNARCPLPQDAATEDIDEILIPYLLRLSNDDPVIDVDTSRFEVAENRVVFATETAAVIAFAQALKMPFADLSSAVVTASASAHATAQDRQTACKFWALKVGRGILMNASKGIDFESVDRAFGGQGRGTASIAREESALSQRLETDNEDEDPIIHGATWASSDRRRNSSSNASRDGDKEDESSRSNAVARAPLEMPGRMVQATAEDEATEEDDDSDNLAERYTSDSSDEDDSPELDEEDEIAQQLFYRSTWSRNMRKDKVEGAVPCGTHTRIFKGHCNVKTVKDVNFYGLNDEYVVSGSDSGHLFIWDKKTGKILNILEGDGEVVNVVQGHPYEPMIAVSGIDHTIKIFSPDSRSRHDARNGIGVTAADASEFSSINHYRSRRRHQSRPDTTSDVTQDVESDGESQVAPNGLSSRRRIHQEYQITSENDSSRQNGGGETYITRGMLERLARTLQERHAAGDADVNLPMLLAGSATEEGDCQMM